MRFGKHSIEAVALVVLLLAGCSRDPQQEKGGQKPAATTSTNAQPVAAAAASTEPQPQSVPQGAASSEMHTNQDWEALRGQLGQASPDDPAANGARALLSTIENITDLSPEGSKSMERFGANSILGLYADVVRAKLAHDVVHRSGNPIKIERAEEQYLKTLEELSATWRTRSITVPFAVYGMSRTHVWLRWNSLPLRYMPPGIMRMYVVPDNLSVTESTYQAPFEQAMNELGFTDMASVMGPRFAMMFMQNPCTPLVERIALCTPVFMDADAQYLGDVWQAVRHSPTALLDPRISARWICSPAKAAMLEEFSSPSLVLAIAAVPKVIKSEQLETLNVGDVLELPVWISEIEPSTQVNNEIFGACPTARRPVNVVAQWSQPAASSKVTDYIRKGDTLAVRIQEDLTAKRRQPLSPEQRNRLSKTIEQSSSAANKYETACERYDKRLRLFFDLEPHLVTSAGATPDLQKLWRSSVTPLFVAPPGTPEGAAWYAENIPKDHVNPAYAPRRDPCTSAYFAAFKPKLVDGTATLGDLERAEAALAWFDDFDADIAVRHSAIDRVLERLLASTDQKLVRTVMPELRADGRQWYRIDPFRGTERQDITEAQFTEREKADLERDLKSSSFSRDEGKYRLDRPYTVSPKPVVAFSKSAKELNPVSFIPVQERWIGFIPLREATVEAPDAELIRQLGGPATPAVGESAVFTTPWKKAEQCRFLRAGREAPRAQVQLYKIGQGQSTVRTGEPITLEPGRYYLRTAEPTAALFLVQDGVDVEALHVQLEKK